ncbi:Ubiquitin thioesterase OTU1 [Nakaseomyces bracarensis]|uniref:Ubiquitin thioesterase OTU n=1 Tax=Nakaseomyces bracarensis TaxID=273131 RepID=A0ABR4NP96_9SACH
MRLKFGGVPGIDKVVTLEKDALLKDIFEPLDVSQADIDAIRFGYPPQKVIINDENLMKNLDDLGLSSGERVTLISEKLKDPVTANSTSATEKPFRLQGNQISLDKNNFKILQLHEVPDDNSCLFHAISYSKHKRLSTSQILREMCAQEILSDKVKYNQAILDQSNEDYARWILQKDAWGGGIEIGILSEYLKVAIYVLDLDSLTIGKFNEERYDDFILISFNGVHYDAIEILDRSNNDTQTVFNLIKDSELCISILNNAVELAKKLRSSGYKFNTRKDKIKCNICQEQFNGEREVAKHAEKTGHVDFGQV